MNPREGSMHGFDVITEMEMSIAPFTPTEFIGFGIGAGYRAARHRASESRRLAA